MVRVCARRIATVNSVVTTAAAKVAAVARAVRFAAAVSVQCRAYPIVPASPAVPTDVVGYVVSAGPMKDRASTVSAALPNATENSVDPMLVVEAAEVA